MSAFGAWVADKSQSLGQILLQRGAGPGRHAAIEILVQEHLRQHGHDPERSLAVLRVVPDVRNQLEVMADLDLQGSLLYVGVAHTAEGDGDADDTRDGWDDSGVVDPGGPLPDHPAARRGGLGEVYVARDQEVHRDVALKQIKSEHADERENRARFLVEAEITGRLEHPGIVPVYGLGTYDDGRPFYAMRFIRGDKFKAAIEQFHSRRAAERDPGRRTLALQQAARPVPRRLQRDRLRPQPRRAPPRPEAGQHHARRVRRDAGGRLGPGQERRPAGGEAGSAALDDRTLVPQSGSDVRGPRRARGWARRRT